MFGRGAAAGGYGCAGPGAQVCEVTHALLPAFVLVGRLDVVESIGAVIERVAAGPVRGATGG